MEVSMKGERGRSKDRIREHGPTIRRSSGGGAMVVHAKTMIRDNQGSREKGIGRMDQVRKS